jgi:predicted signal transduction protein with EAL and GGDEF domain
MSLMHLLDQPLLIGEHTVQIGASVGIAIFPEDARDMESLCIAADLRMYNIKHGASEGNTISASRLPDRSRRCNRGWRPAFRWQTRGPSSHP